MGRAATTVWLGLHVGDAFYGNIGSDERLDFTVVGPAVNEVSRIVSMCGSVDRDLLASAAFVATVPAAERARFASVGRFALRGVRRAEELLTLDEEEGGGCAIRNRMKYRDGANPVVFLKSRETSRNAGASSSTPSTSLIARAKIASPIKTCMTSKGSRPITSHRNSYGV